MKKLFFLLLLSSVVHAQNFTVRIGETATINKNYGVIEMQSNSKLIIEKGSGVEVGNLNINGSSVKIEIPEKSALKILSSLNQNGDVHVLNNGSLVVVTNVELQGGNPNNQHAALPNTLINNGNMTVGGDLQINDKVSQLTNKGIINIKGWFNLNNTKEGAYLTEECATVQSHGLNVNAKAPVAGKGSLTFQDINIHDVLTYSTSIYVYYWTNLNTQDKWMWGNSKLNNKTNCADEDPLPVVVHSFSFTPLENNTVFYKVKFTEFTGAESVIMQYTIDGVNFVDYEIPFDPKNLKNEYSGTINLNK